MAEKFFFGAATSAHQVEGNNHNDWTEWEKKNAERLVENAYKRHAKDPWGEHILEKYFTPLQVANYISGKACDHYHRFKEDFDIVRSLGHNAHRFSIEWSRVEPREGEFDANEIEHYREVIRALRARGIEPFVTLWHFTLPIWLAEEGGILSRNFPRYFARYAGKMAEAFKGEVKFWIPMNESGVYGTYSYFLGKWPPQKKNLLQALKLIDRYVRANRMVYAAIKAVDPETKIGNADNYTYFDAATGVANNILKFFAERIWNTLLLNRVRDSIDFIGVNYYFRNRIDWGLNKNPNELTSDVGWEIYPEGIYHVIKHLEKYNLPLYITENGIADARDTNRESFLRKHLSWVRKAIDEGADVRGYFHWSLLDNFEWDSGFWPCFGLVEVDYATMKRTVRPSALAYKKIIEGWDTRGPILKNEE